MCLSYETFLKPIWIEFFMAIFLKITSLKKVLTVSWWKEVEKAQRFEISKRTRVLTCWQDSTAVQYVITLYFWDTSCWSCRIATAYSIRLILGGAVQVQIMLRPMVSRPVCPGIRPPSRTRYQFFLGVITLIISIAILFAVPAHKWNFSSPRKLSSLLFYLVWGALFDERKTPFFKYNQFFQNYKLFLGTKNRYNSPPRIKIPIRTGNVSYRNFAVYESVIRFLSLESDLCSEKITDSLECCSINLIDCSWQMQYTRPYTSGDPDGTLRSNLGGHTNQESHTVLIWSNIRANKSCRCP
jgi:hypothetical protein